MKPSRLVAHILVASFVVVALLPVAAQSLPQSLPTKLDDTTFWRLVTDYSEQGGFFRSDNFVSN